MMHRFLWGAGVLIVALVVVAGAVWGLRRGSGVKVEGSLDRRTFQCFAVGESMRTIGYSRAERKQKQLARIERLLERELDPLDEAKLRSERAILRWELADARFQRDCAESYFEPGSSSLRERFPSAPPSFDSAGIREAFEEAQAKTPPRLRPHGFDERSSLHLAESALEREEYDRAIEQARARLAEEPEGLYIDMLKLVLADALLAQGAGREAEELYGQVGKLPIGEEAHYARYKQALLLKARGQDDEAQELLGEVLEWAKRGDREALVKVLRGDDPPPSRKPSP